LKNGKTAQHNILTINSFLHLCRFHLKNTTPERRNNDSEVPTSVWVLWTQAIYHRFIKSNRSNYSKCLL